jgi:serine/threonine protein kinase
MNLEIGSTVGDYQIVGILGAGGMGKVYKVRNLISDRIEAMKILLPDLGNAPDLADRFMREIKVQASLEHPNIAALHTALRAENQLVMLMEFVEGVTLEQQVKQQGRLPVGAAIDYMRQVLAALDYAHARGVVHRDIKPANMMLTPGGVVKLMDFGIAKAAGDQKLTMTGTTMGSLYYMSPEQIQGSTSLDARADLYSVGVSLYELLTGTRPFDGDSQFSIMSAHLEKTPVPPITLDPNLPQGLNDIIMMAVLKDPGQRFQTAGAFRNALAAAAPPVLASTPASSIPTSPVSPMAAPAQQGDFRLIEPTSPESPGGKRGLWMALGAVAAVLAVVGIVQFGPFKGTKAAPEPQQQVAVPSNPPASPPPVTQAPTPEQSPAPAQTPVSAPVQTPLQTNAPPPVSPAQKVVARPNPAQQQPAAAAVKTASPPVQEKPAAAPPEQVHNPSQPVVASPAPAGPSRAEMQAAREQLMMLNTRAGSVRGTLQTLARSQAAGGLNLRGDMQEAANMMGSYLDGANAALQAGDPASAKSFMDKAERQLEKLEKFLNR